MKRSAIRTTTRIIVEYRDPLSNAVVPAEVIESLLRDGFPPRRTRRDRKAGGGG